MEEVDIQLPNVDEPDVTFKFISDRDIMSVESADNGEGLIEISGYDLQIKFNMQYLKSIEDIDAACKGIADLFRETIVEKLLETHKQ